MNLSYLCVGKHPHMPVGCQYIPTTILLSVYLYNTMRVHITVYISSFPVKIFQFRQARQGRSGRGGVSSLRTRYNHTCCRAFNSGTFTTIYRLVATRIRRPAFSRNMGILQSQLLGAFGRIRKTSLERTYVTGCVNFSQGGRLIEWRIFRWN